MKTLDRYFIRRIVVDFLYALAALLAVFSVINLMEELENVGTGEYGLRQALWFVFLTLPNEAHKLSPSAALLGTVTALGGMAGHNELIAILAAGVSRRRLTRYVMQGAGCIVLAAIVLGEFVAAPVTKRAQSQRSTALSGGLALGTSTGVWARDGSRFVNARTLLPGGNLRDLYVFDFDEEKRIRTFSRAEKAHFAGDSWILENLVEDRFIGDEVETERVAVRVWDSQLVPRQLDFLVLRPEDLSLADLDRSIRSLRKRNESASRHQLAFWRRLGMPLITAVMVFVALPFVLTTLQRATIGKRLVIAALSGVGFQMFNQTFAGFALAYGLDPKLCAFLPAVLVCSLGVWGMARTS